MINRKELRSRLSSSHINESVRTEIAIMSSLDHPNIVKLYEALEDENSKKIYLVMEYCSKSALLTPTFWKAHDQGKNNFLIEMQTESDEKKNRLTLYQAKSYFIQIVKGLNYCTFMLISAQLEEYRTP